MSLALNTVVYNEAPRIKGLLEHAAAYCDELIVVDQSSTDGTGDLAHDFGATVIIDEHRGFCEPSRPLAAIFTESDWILVLDGDEIIATPYIYEITQLPQSTFSAGWLSMGAYIDGMRVGPIVDGEFHPNHHCRIFRKGAVKYGMRLHTRILPIVGPEWRSGNEPRILNAKSTAEHEIDLQRDAIHV